MNGPVLVLGGGLAGLSTAIPLGDDATVLERDSVPGGLVRTECIEGYWFDRVIHLLYFRDKDAEARVAPLLGETLASTPPAAWVVTSAGTARFPLQLHLGHLDTETAAACLTDMARARFREPEVHNYEELLRASFGESLFQLFFKPYNEKMWKRPLQELAPAGFQWNLHRPDLEDAIRGGLEPDLPRRSYNAYGFYPRPPANSRVRGMQCLSAALAGEVRDLRLEHEVLRIEPERRSVRVRGPQGEHTLHWSHRAVSTLPLPLALERCVGVPADLLSAVRGLRRNAVASVAIRVEGPRPDLGMWRYYPDPDLCFTRLVFLHAFDPGLAPPEGWPLLVEVTWPAEDVPNLEALLSRIVADVERCGELPAGSRIVGTDILWVDPAYVVFELGAEAVIGAARAWLEENGIETVGRYGRWEYSSMAGVITDGLHLGDALAAELG